MTNRDIALKMVKDLVLSYEAYNEIHTLAKSLFGDIVESPLGDKLGDMVCRHIKALEYAISDTEHSWIDWYVWETGCGVCDTGDIQLSANVNGIEYFVDTPEKFIDLLIALELVK